ncbi:OmpA family protein [Pseudoxanthomonas winnipegensis]|uniref:OmpA family protein n=1 Tax=Pseudoxanthomonas winnipegensis TaxID=2480810 RepID=UPI00103F77AF|nr:OmpA family protein [Pseudoxanthomonas winnipegensis]TBV76397.1 outer membrane protein assembly factor BamE [Pseudoxanthomonas winnipegensis]
MKTFHTPGVRILRLLTVLLSTAALMGCGTLSKGIENDGSSAQTLVWPAPQDANSLAKDGTYPTPESLGLLHPGLDKAQVLRLLGPPHFHEGFGPREWDYLVHLRQPGASDFTTCQLKLLFGKDGKVGSLHWKPAGCLPATQAVAATTPRPPAEPYARTLLLDVLFPFDLWEMKDLQPDGKRQLDTFAAELRAPELAAKRITLRAYADRLGGAAYNLRLSERRAATIARYLTQQGGVEASRLHAVGMGASDPVSQGCVDTMSRDALIACLAPDRRVTLSAADVP